MDKFKIKGDYIELIKLLKAAGVCENGSQAKDLVESGQIKVNGQEENRKRAKILPGSIVSTPAGDLKVE